jgi:predicted nucleic acid-binding protein
MTAYCDTSFIIGHLLRTPHRSKALAASAEVEKRLGFVPITEFTRFEIVQGLRFEAWRNKNDRTRGFSLSEIEPALNLFLAQIGSGFEIQAIQWAGVFVEAERMSRATPDHGWRMADLLHVATANLMHADEFYSFDRQQNLLATSQGLKTPLAN